MTKLFTMLAPLVPLLVAVAPAAASAGATGSITGVVELAGEAPAREALSMTRDPVCARGKTQLSEAVIAEDGMLRDVHVRIRAETVSGDHAVPGERVKIDQSGCMYRPRVVGVMAGQKLAIGNSDPTLHNIHGYAGGRSRFNLGQPPRGPTIEREVGDAGSVLELRCDIHPWMRAYAVVSDHPFFAVTGADGTFTIEDIPVGTYTLEAWHPELGLERATLEVKPNASARHAFAFSPD